MISGTTFTGVETSGNVDLAGDTSESNITLGAGNYYNVPATFTNVTFDTTNGNVMLEMDRANTTYMFNSCTYVGTTNKIKILPNAANIVISTSIANSNFATQAGGSGSYTITTPKATVKFTGHKANSRIVVRQSGSVTETTKATTTADAVMTTQYDLTTTITYRVFCAGYKPVSGSLTFSASGQNTITIAQEVSDGYSTPTVTVRTINGTTINAGGAVDISTTGSTIGFTNALPDLREALSAVASAWVDQSTLYNLDTSYPFDLDSVSGIEILEPWALVDDDNSQNEGYIRMNATTGAISLMRMCIITTGNTDPVRLRIYNGATVQQDISLTVQPINTLVTIDHTQTTVTARMEIKNADEVFIVNTETFIANGKSQKKFYKNSNTAFTQNVDATITGTVRYDVAITKVVTATRNDVDANGTTRTFAKAFQIYNDTTTRQDLLNQIAAIMAADDSFNSKTYTLNGNIIVLPQGCQVIYANGNIVSGQLTAFLTVRDNSGNAFVFPQQRPLVISHGGTFTGSINYAVVNAAGNVITDADGVAVQGSIAQNASINRGIPTNVDTALTVYFSANGCQPGSASGTLILAGLTFSLTPYDETVMLYSNEAQATDDINAGTRAWNTEIDNITIDWTNKVITVPNSILDCEINFLYRKWKKSVDADTTKLSYGIALVGTNQSRAPTATNNQYLWNPEWSFDNNWAVNCAANRSVSSPLQLSASNIDRNDTANRNGVVYVFPLANGSAPVLRLVVGTSQEFQVDTTNKLTAMTDDLTTTLEKLDVLKRNLTNLM
jgi:hypothetical protein